MKSAGGIELGKLEDPKKEPKNLEPIHQDITLTSPRFVLGVSAIKFHTLGNRAYINAVFNLTNFMASMPHSQGLSNNSHPEPNQPNSPH